MTTAIARVVAQRYREAQGTLRLSYFTSVFRQDRSMRGSEREYDQAGVELIGAGGSSADAEVLAVVCDALAAVGLRSFTIEVGHIGAVRQLFEGLSPELLDGVLAHLRASDHVEAFRVATTGLGAERIERARRGLAARGRGIEDVGVPAALELREAIHLARELYPGEPRWGVPNLSVIPPLPYYTGLVFEVVSPHVGAPIAAGGRYDGLLARYGSDRAATGFAIAVPLLHRALVADGWALASDGALISLTGADEPVRLRVAGALRASGLAVAIGPIAESAGRRVVKVEAIDERSVRYDGRSLPIEELSSILPGAGE